MTGKTTRIWVELTDEQMDIIQQSWGHGSNSHRAIQDAVIAQRPRPIAAGDRVIGPRTGVFITVEFIKDGWAWTWYQGSPWGGFKVSDLTRADGEAAS